MILPDSFYILFWEPSKWEMVISRPVRASRRVISLSMNKSAPFLLNVLFSFILITAITSPGSTSGTQSPSPWSVNYSLSGDPLSTSTYSVLVSLLTFLPLHTLQRFAMSIIWPCPSHSSQGPVLWLYIPGPIYLIMVRMPLPLQTVHVWTADASDPPIPLQALQIRYLSTSRSKVLPLYTSARLHSIYERLA